MRILLSVALALMVNLTAAQQTAAVSSYVTLYGQDGGQGAYCSGFTWDGNLNNGISGGIGNGCGNDWGNSAESLWLHFETPSVCWILYTGGNYGGTAYVFHDHLEGFYELPASQDNLFSSYSKGTQGGSTCIAQHP